MKLHVLSDLHLEFAPFTPAVTDANFASDLEELVIESGVLLCVHGHIHSQSDYRIGDTRIIANPRGYPREDVGEFNADLVVEV